MILENSRRYRYTTYLRSRNLSGSKSTVPGEIIAITYATSYASDLKILIYTRIFCFTVPDNPST